ncbi:MAG: hypothetical protein H0V53_02395 [Rubrobacter sp.]|nr:hypothetical protein [Rubrobacter sp.]
MKGSEGQAAGSEGWKEFSPFLKTLARGPDSLADLDPETCEEAASLILRGIASPAQAAGFFLIGRVKGNGAGELAGISRALRAFCREVEAPAGGPPVVTVTGGFDGKVRTMNVGAAASVVAAAAGGRVFLVGGEDVPPKHGRTSFDALRNLGVSAPQTVEESRGSLAATGLAASTPEHYLPELHGLLQLRREMVRRTAINVSEKLISPVPGSRMMVGMTHRHPFLETMPEALRQLGTAEPKALVFQAIEGSDEAPLDGNSALVLVTAEGSEEFNASPAFLGLPRATRADIPWRGPEDERERLLAALEGEQGPVGTLVLYNAALRLFAGGDGVPLEDCLVRAETALRSGEALDSLERLRRPVRVSS